MNAVSKILLVCMTLIQMGCATSIKGKTLRNAAIASAVGVAYGTSREDHKSTHAAMYGGIAGLTAVLASVYLYDPDKEIENVRKQSRELAKSFDEFAENSSRGSSRRYSTSGSSTRNSSALPEKYRDFITPGEWVLKEIDEYERIDENTIVHKDQLFELIPAKINERN